MKTIIILCAVILAVLAGAVYFTQPANHSFTGLFAVTVLGEGALFALMAYILRSEDKQKNKK